MLESETLRELYSQMVRIRVFESALKEVYYEGKTPTFNFGAGPIPGGLYLSRGQEHVAVGVCLHLRPTDAVTGSHRQLHQALAKGVDMKRLAAEIFGKETGLSHGRGGTCHIFDRGTGFTSSGMIAEGIPQAVGHALAFRKQGRDDIAVAFFGDGAANQGACHEALNLAALWKLSVLFVCEDNGWAISVPHEKARMLENISERSAGYGIPAALVVDNNPVAVYEVAEEAVGRARKGEGPYFIEVKCPRIGGHGEGDDQDYRSQSDIQRAIKQDPFARLESELLQSKVLSEADVGRIGQTAEAEVNAAIAFARSSPYPEPETARDYVFA